MPTKDIPQKKMKRVMAAPEAIRRRIVAAVAFIPYPKFFVLCFTHKMESIDVESAINPVHKAFPRKVEKYIQYGTAGFRTK